MASINLFNNNFSGNKIRIYMRKSYTLLGCTFFHSHKVTKEKVCENMHVACENLTRSLTKLRLLSQDHSTKQFCP